MTAAAHDDRPAEQSAEVHVLHEGYADLGVTPFSVASTVTYVQDGDARLIIDPGFVRRRRSILDPLDRLGVDPGAITDVIFSHHHPDHTLNAALFPNARVHDYWAIYKDDTWESRPAEGFQVSPSVRLIQTPGHTRECITTLAGTAEGVTAFTHLWLSSAGPAEDPLASDPAGLHAGRARVLEIATMIVPGHGAPLHARLHHSQITARTWTAGALAAHRHPSLPPRFREANDPTRGGHSVEAGSRAVAPACT